MKKLVFKTELVLGSSPIGSLFIEEFYGELRPFDSPDPLSGLIPWTTLERAQRIARGRMMKLEVF